MSVVIVLEIIKAANVLYIIKIFIRLLLFFMFWTN